MEKENELLRSFGGNISSRPMNHIFARFEYARWNTTPLTLSSSMHLGNFYNSIKASARLDFPGEAPLYLKASTLYSSWEFSRSSIFLFEEQRPPFLSQREFIANFALGYPLEHDKKIEIGGMYCATRDDYFNTGNFSEADTMDQSRFRPYIVFTSLEKSSLNRKQFPTRGSYYFFEFRLVRGNEEYTPGTTAWSLNQKTQTRSWAEALFQYKNFFRPRSRFNPGFSAELFLSHKPLFSNYTASVAMARQYSPFPLATSLYMPRFRANNYAAAGLKTIYSLSESASIQSEVHFFQPFQTIDLDATKNSVYTDYRFNPGMMANLALVYHTAPGPLSISMSYFHKEQENLVFMFNFGFILFNKQAFM